MAGLRFVDGKYLVFSQPPDEIFVDVDKLGYYGIDNLHNLEISGSWIVFIDDVKFGYIDGQLKAQYGEVIISVQVDDNVKATLLSIPNECEIIYCAKNETGGD